MYIFLNRMSCVLCGGLSVSLTSSRSHQATALQRGAGWHHRGLRRTGSALQPLCLPPHLLHPALKPLQLLLQLLLLTLQQVPLLHSLGQHLLKLRLSCYLRSLGNPGVSSSQSGHQHLQHGESGLQALHLRASGLRAAGLHGAGYGEGVLASSTSIVSPPESRSVLCVSSEQETAHAQREKEEHTGDGCSSKNRSEVYLKFFF